MLRSVDVTLTRSIQGHCEWGYSEGARKVSPNPRKLRTRMKPRVLTTFADVTRDQRLTIVELKSVRPIARVF